MFRKGKIKRLKYLIDPNHRTPLILIHHNKSNEKSGEEALLQSSPRLIINFNEITDGRLEEYLYEISSFKHEIIIFLNIDKIFQGADMEYWESIITIALKQENYPIDFQDKEGNFKKYELPFHKIKVVTTCSKYPDYLKDKGMLGEIIDLKE